MMMKSHGFTKIKTHSGESVKVEAIVSQAGGSIAPRKVLFGILYVLGFWPLMVSGEGTAKAPAEHIHRQVEIPSELSQPQIELKLIVDDRSGYNLHIDLRNYRIEPPEFRDDPVDGLINGHAHLFINGVKIRRLYGLYTHVEPGLLNAGVNIIAVTLNSHEHDTWTVSNRPLTASVTIDTTRENPIVHHFSSSTIGDS